MMHGALLNITQLQLESPQVHPNPAHIMRMRLTRVQRHMWAYALGMRAALAVRQHGQSCSDAAGASSAGGAARHGCTANGAGDRGGGAARRA